MIDRDPNAETQRGGFYAGRVWTLNLWGLASPRLGLIATLATVALLAASRFVLLPSGPWEWDETLFARGLLRFDLAAHFPHPPGFPLWMALGWLLLPFVSEPLRGFQFLSAAASCLTIFPLTALGKRVAPAPVATMAGLALLFSPAVWLHAGRGFTDTPAAFFAFWAAALALYGLEGRRATAFTMLVTSSFLIRPVLLPPLGLLWLAGALAVHPRRRLLPGVLLGAGATGGAILGLVHAQGSWAGFCSAFAAHATIHARNLVEHNPGSVLDLGLVKGIGGPWFTLALAVLTLLGVAVWWRGLGRKPAFVCAVILAVLVVQLVWLQNRRFPRYAVPLHLALAPLAAGAAAAAAPPAIAIGALAALGIAWGASTYPLLVEQHTRLLPGWEAVGYGVETAKRGDLDIVVEPGLFPFMSYAEELDRRAGREWKFKYYLAPSSPDSKELPSRSYLLITDYPFHYFAPLAGSERRFGPVSGDLLPLTQGRFLNALVAGSVPLPVRGWWLPELPPGTTEKFMWGGAQAEVLVPPLRAGSTLAIDFVPFPGPASVEVTVEGAVALSEPGDAPRAVRVLDPRLFSAQRTSRLAFRRAEAYAPAFGDTRRLAVQLWGITLVDTRVASPTHGGQPRPGK